MTRSGHSTLEAPHFQTKATHHHSSILLGRFKTWKFHPSKNISKSKKGSQVFSQLLKRKNKNIWESVKMVNRFIIFPIKIYEMQQPRAKQYLIQELLTEKQAAKKNLQSWEGNWMLYWEGIDIWSLPSSRPLLIWPFLGLPSSRISTKLAALLPSLTFFRRFVGFQSWNLGESIAKTHY